MYYTYILSSVKPQGR